MNKIHMTGGLTRDIEIRYQASGLAIGKSAIAMTRKFNQGGERKEEVCYIDIVWFGKSAETANQYLNKGSKVLITGRLAFSKWQDHTGVTKTKNEVVVEEMEFLDIKTKKPSDLDSTNQSNSMPIRNGVENTSSMQHTMKDEAEGLF